MKGYLKILASEFTAWNEAATVQANNDINNLGCDSYTFSTPDTDPNYVWARVEHAFIEGDIKTREEAYSLGMVQPESEMP